jgi:hypothetical protein
MKVFLLNICAFDNGFRQTMAIDIDWGCVRTRNIVKVVWGTLFVGVITTLI